MPESATSGQKLVVLAAGPSLAASIVELEGETSQNVSFMSVNDLFKSECFWKLRPKYHVIADPIYWFEECYVMYGAPLVGALKDADWPLTLLLPYRARGSQLHLALAENSIIFEFYPTTTVRGLPTLERLVFRHRFGMPRPQNVLVAAVAIAIWLEFKRVGIVGADHSWHQSLLVNDQNCLMVQQTHAYDESAPSVPFWKPEGVRKLTADAPLTRGDTFSMREILLAWAAVHDSYERLERLSKYSGVSLINCSKVSFIDAFKRMSLQQFLDLAPAGDG